MEDRFLIGYARVSTDEQDLQMQIDALRKYGVPDDMIIQEKISGKSLHNRDLWAKLQYMRAGDRVVVWKLDRLGRSVKDLIELIEFIEGRGGDVVSLTDGIDTTTAMGRFFFHIMAAIAELERGMISERTKEGMASRKAADPDVKWGAPHWFTDNPKRKKHIQGLYNDGEFTLVSSPTPKNPDAVRSKGMTAGALMAEANAEDPEAKKIKNVETVYRWLREGAPGLEYTLSEDTD